MDIPQKPSVGKFLEILDLLFRCGKFLAKTWKPKFSENLLLKAIFHSVVRNDPYGACMRPATRQQQQHYDNNNNNNNNTINLNFVLRQVHRVWWMHICVEYFLSLSTVRSTSATERHIYRRSQSIFFSLSCETRARVWGISFAMSEQRQHTKHVSAESLFPSRLLMFPERAFGDRGKPHLDAGDIINAHELFGEKQISGN